MTFTVRLRPNRQKRLKSGHPWVFSNEVDMTPQTKEIPPGALVNFAGDNGEAYGTGFFNSKSLVCGRILSRKPLQSLDVGFFAERLRQALNLREPNFTRPYYRLVHAEADGLPGLIVDRFDDLAVLQLNTAGMQNAESEIVDALARVMSLRAYVLKNDSPVRQLEGLPIDIRTGGGDVPTDINVEENGISYIANLTEGQKTGWFYDQRENRRFVGQFANGRSFLDCYSHSGGFGVLAAVNGASAVTFVDGSQAALELARRSASLNNAESACTYVQADGFEALQKFRDQDVKFDVAVIDPPSFVKSKKALNSGLRGYRKLARLAAQVVEPGGFLFIASCSHNVATDQFTSQVVTGIADAKRSGRILRTSGADIDHPAHIHLPETAYLKGLFLQLD